MILTQRFLSVVRRKVNGRRQVYSGRIEGFDESGDVCRFDFGWVPPDVQHATKHARGFGFRTGAIGP